MSRVDRVLLSVAFLAFASLGLPDGVLGVAWPSVRQSFGLMVSELGALLVSAMAGYLVSAFCSGPIVARLGVGLALVWSSGTMVVAAVGYSLAPTWPVMVAFGVLTGLGAGAIDAGINAFAAARFRPGQVNWLHACYGVGAMLGPVLMTSVLAAGRSWRLGYVLIAAILAVLTVAFAFTVRLWAPASPNGEAAPGGAAGDGKRRDDRGGTPGRHPGGLIAALRHPPVWTNVAIFFVYTGLEGTAGQWAYTLFTESRGVPMGLAGGAVAAYWGSLTLGRLIFGALARRHAPERLLRVALVAAPPAAALVWASAGAIGSTGSLAALGLVLAPIFPLLISLTPGRVGSAHAATAIGFQIAGAYLGAAVLPGVAGVLAHRFGLEAIGLVLIVAAGGALGLDVWARRQGTARLAIAAAATLS